jgi:hypothetical protein
MSCPIHFGVVKLSTPFVYIVFGPLILFACKMINCDIKGLLDKLSTQEVFPMSRLVIQILQYVLQYTSRLVQILMISFQFGILVGFVPIPKLHFM